LMAPNSLSIKSNSSKKAFGTQMRIKHVQLNVSMKMICLMCDGNPYRGNEVISYTHTHTHTHKEKKPLIQGWPTFLCSVPSYKCVTCHPG
jgi:hypothetical protein